MKKDITAKSEWEQEWDTDELPVEFYQLRKQHLEQSPQSKSRGMHVFVKPLTIEKLEVLSWIAGVNKSQYLNLLLNDNDVFTYLASAALRHAKKAEVNDARRFRVLARTEERRNGLGQLNIESQELYSHLKDKEAFFQEYAYIRCLQEFYFGNGELDKWSQETNRLDRMLKILVSNRGSFLVNGSFMDFVSSMEYKYELSREDMLKRQFLVTDEELQTKYKYANPLLNSDVFTSDAVASATSERTPSMVESKAPEVPNLLASEISKTPNLVESEVPNLSDAENSGVSTSNAVTLDSSLSDSEDSENSDVSTSIPVNSDNSDLSSSSDSSSSDSVTTSTIHHSSSIHQSSSIQQSSTVQNSNPTQNSSTVPNSVVAKLASILDLSSGAPECSGATSRVFLSQDHVLHVPQSLTLETDYPEQASLVLSSTPSSVITLPTEIKPYGRTKLFRGITPSNGIQFPSEYSVQRLSAEAEAETESKYVVSQPSLKYSEASVPQLYSTEQTDSTCEHTDYTCSTVVFNGQVNGLAFTKNDAHTHDAHTDVLTHQLQGTNSTEQTGQLTTGLEQDTYQSTDLRLNQSPSLNHLNYHNHLNQGQNFHEVYEKEPVAHENRQDTVLGLAKLQDSELSQYHKASASTALSALSSVSTVPSVLSVTDVSTESTAILDEPASNTCSAVSTFKAKSVAKAKFVSNDTNQASTSSTSNDTGANEVSGLSGVRKVSKVRRVSGVSNERVDTHTSSLVQETSVQDESEQSDTMGMQELIDVLSDMLIRAK